jgi:hypothetical protein
MIDSDPTRDYSPKPAERAREMAEVALESLHVIAWHTLNRASEGFKAGLTDASNRRHNRARALAWLQDLANTPDIPPEGPGETPETS